MLFQYVILLSISISCLIIRMIYEIFNYKKAKFISTPVVFRLMSFFMGCLWFSWFALSDFDPMKINLEDWVRWTGFGIFILGMLFAVVSVIQIIISFIISKIKKEDKLITNGVFAITRHPMYLGFILWLIGYPIFKEALFTLTISIIWLINILIWRHLEEKELLEKFKNFKEYQKRTIF